MDLSALQSLKNKRIAVIGDICLDCYYFLDKQHAEISVETGLPAKSVSRLQVLPGRRGKCSCPIAGLWVLGLLISMES